MHGNVFTPSQQPTHMPGLAHDQQYITAASDLAEKTYIVTISTLKNSLSMKKTTYSTIEISQ